MHEFIYIILKGEAGTGNVYEAVKHARALKSGIDLLCQMTESQLQEYANSIRVPTDLVLKTAELKRLPVVTFAAGGIATPADAALMMQLGMDGVFVGSGIFKSDNPKARAQAIVEAVTHYKDGARLATVSENLGEAMNLK